MSGAGQALIYCRVSTRHQEEEGTSLDSQEAACIRHAEELGYGVGRITREVFSGAELWDRPLLARDRAELKSGAYQALIAYATDRLARDPIHLAIIADECSRAGVELHFVTEPLDTSDEGSLIRYVKGYAAKIEREKIKERSMRGRLGRLQSGKIHNAGGDLFGYRKDREQGVRVIDDTEAAVVRGIFTWYVEDRLSINAITQRLNASIPAPSAGKRRFADGRAPRWGSRTVHVILSNPAYKGETVAWTTRRVHDGPQVRTVRRPDEEMVRLSEGVTPAIVSGDLWDAAQIRLATNTGASTRNRSNPCLLRGLITCAVCGLSMTPGSDGLKKGGRRVYRCPSPHRHGTACGGKPVRIDDKVAVKPQIVEPHGGARWVKLTDELRATLPTLPGIDTWVWRQVSAYLQNPAIIVADLERRRVEGPDPLLVADHAAALRALAELERQQERLVKLYASADDDMPLTVVKDQIAAAERQKAQWRLTLEDLEARLAAEAEATDQLDSLVSWCERWAQNLETFTFEQRRLTLEALGVRVTAQGSDPAGWTIRGRVPLGTIEPDAVLLSTTPRC